MNNIIVFFLFVLFSLNLSAADATKHIFKINRPNYDNSGSDGVNYKNLSVQFAIKYDKSTCHIKTSNPIATYMVHKSSEKYYGKLTSNNRKAFAVNSSQYSVDENVITFTTKAFKEIGQKLGKKVTFITGLEKSGSKCKATTEVFVGNQKKISSLKYMDMYFNLKNYNIPGIAMGLHPKKSNPIKSVKLLGRNKSHCLIGNCP